MKNILFLSSFDARKLSSWSGTPSNMLNSLEKTSLSIDTVGPINNYSKLIIRAFSYILKIMKLNNLDASHSILASIEYKYRIEKLLKNKNYDFIISPAGSNLIAFLNVDIPILYLSDTTFKQFTNYYSEHNKLSWFSRKAGDFLEKRALNNASLVSFPSLWASQYAIKEYNLDPSKVLVANWGPNLPDVPSVVVRDLKKEQVIKFLFLGVDWLRKGGDTVFLVVKDLINRGYKAELHICGCDPIIDSGELPEWVFTYGKLNKSVPSDYSKLVHLFKSSDFLFVPSIAECYGMVFCEACAFSLPSITTNTGGITSIIYDRYNGFTLPINSSIDSYVSSIIGIINNPSEYKKMSMRARNSYEVNYNWDSWAKKIIENLVKL